jgi:stage II sporulation protein D
MNPSHHTAPGFPRRVEGGGPAGKPRLAAQLERRSRLTLAGALVVFTLLIAAGPAGAWTSESEFLINGHGWGHGIGMSQWGCYGYAKHGWTYKAILKHYYTGIAFGEAANADIRVRLRSGLKVVKVSCPKAYTAQGTGTPLEIPAGETATTTFVDGSYRVVAGSVRRDFGAPVTFTPSSGALRVLTATDLGDTGPYRGVIRVVRSDGALMMINSVPLESYLRGSVPHEVSPSWPAEALKAQACAARAFALGSRKPSQSWDVYCDVRSQAYVGVGIEDPRTDAAVLATAGVVPTYEGRPIQAYYFSCSGGHTENFEDGWPGAGITPIPYLKGVDDPYDYYGSLHDWGPLRRTATQIGGPLGVKGSLRAVYTVERGSSPRIVKAALIGTSGVKFMYGNELRMKLGLNSTWAVFTSMSISPAPRDHASVSAGGSLTLTGRIYPALATGATVRLVFSYDGTWHGRSVTTTRGSENLGGGYKASYSEYSEDISPEQATQYYFAAGKSHSPTITVAVK